MRPFTTKKAICLFFALALAVPLVGLNASPSQAVVKGKNTKGKAKPKVVKTSSGQQETKPLDLEGMKLHLEGRLTNIWRPNSTGKTTYAEIWFLYHSDGRYSDMRVWRSSGNANYDQMCKNCIDQCGQFGPFVGLDEIKVIAVFETEAKGADVTIRFPDYLGTDSMVERQIAAKRVQQDNIIKIMKQRIKSAQAIVGPDSPKLSESINFLANTYKDIADWASAEAAYKWAISIREKNNGPNSKELAQSLSDMGDMYFWKGDVPAAENCYKRVINMPSLPPCPQLLTCLQRYAKLCVKNGREKDANILYKRMEDISSGKPLAPLPDNMKMDPATGADSTKSESTAGGDKPVAGSDKPATGNDKPATGSDKPATSSDKPATGSDKSATDSDKPAIGSDKPSSSSSTPSSSEQDKSSASDKTTAPASK